MSKVIYLQNEPLLMKSKQGETLNLKNKVCKVYITKSKESIYFLFTEETKTTFGGIRLQRDQYNNNKFYVTDEKNKWHGVNRDGSFTKGRDIYVYN